MPRALRFLIARAAIRRLHTVAPRRLPYLGTAALCIASLTLSACGGSSNGGGSGSPTQVQIVQPPPDFVQMGTPVGLVATVTNDSNNAGVTWSCTPADSCGTFSPTTTGFDITTLYTPPSTPPAGTTSVNIPVTITATSVADSSLSASSNVTLQVGSVALLQGQYAFAQQGYASFGLIGSVILDGNGNITGGEADGSANGFYTDVPTITGTYTVDATGHGSITYTLTNTGCCGTFTQTNSLTVTSSSHAVIAESDQFNGLTIGGIGSLDLQASAPDFSASQVSGGYSFSLTGFSSAAVKAAGGTGLNGTWAGVFTADGAGNVSSGTFDTSEAGGAPNYSSVSFTGTYSAPDAFGRGVLSTDLNGGTDYVYYIVTPEVLRLTSMTNTGYAGTTGSAFGQGSVGTTNAAISGSYIFDSLGFDVGGSATASAGQFTADGSGNISSGIMDLNDSGSGVLTTGLSWAGSSYVISGSPRGTITGPSGQTYNVYLTDPNLNLLDPNNPTGTGGALLLETDASYSGIGILLPQADPSSATLQGPYALQLSDQNGPANSDGGYTGSFGTSSTSLGTFSGEGDFQTQNTVDPVLGPLSGVVVADTANPGRLTGTITTTPAFPNGDIAGTAPGSEQVSLYMANSSQGFVVETDSVAPVSGIVEAQAADASGNLRGKQHASKQAPHRKQTAIRRLRGPVNKAQFRQNQ